LLPEGPGQAAGVVAQAPPRAGLVGGGLEAGDAPNRSPAAGRRSNSAPPSSSDAAHLAISAPGAQHHADLVLEEAPPAALGPDASVHHAATSTALRRSLSAPLVGLVGGVLDAGDSPNRSPSAGRRSTSAPRWAHTWRPSNNAAHPDISAPGDQHHAFEEAPPAAPTSSLPLGCDPVATGFGVSAEVGEIRAAVETPIGPAVTNPGAANSRAPGAPAVPRAPTRRPHPQLIEDEENVEEVRDPELEAHCKYVKKVSAWRKGYTVCLICHLEGKEKELKADNEEIIKHCRGIHQGPGYKCEKCGCLARGKNKHDTGLHEIECRGGAKKSTSGKIF
ncbi:hypothetical protein EJB05_27426, partial [Eragrostis curvula]